ncbi:hypothetical protein GUJ93_ZPchr0008g13669 [Zizania palustris]|uniref:Uncharacterized protein n=1 Tax=Zizania palustris TaxID=103762 RepID=A0A8J5RK95_ZIZPA|nr:hypothetical protein GUJ93_ZPchr0008g13669 [Zizania palustris]
MVAYASCRLRQNPSGHAPTPPLDYAPPPSCLSVPRLLRQLLRESVYEVVISGHLRPIVLQGTTSSSALVTLANFVLLSGPVPDEFKTDGGSKVLTQPPRRSVVVAYPSRQKHVVNFLLLRVDPTQSARTLVVSHVFWLIPINGVLRLLTGDFTIMEQDVMTLDDWWKARR